MTWNHRVMRSVDKHGEVSFTIREVFYDDNGEIGEGWTAEGIDPYGETLDELRECLTRMLAACDRPVLDEQVLLAEWAARFPNDAA